MLQIMLRFCLKIFPFLSQFRLLVYILQHIFLVKNLKVFFFSFLFFFSFFKMDTVSSMFIFIMFSEFRNNQSVCYKFHMLFILYICHYNVYILLLLYCIYVVETAFAKIMQEDVFIDVLNKNCVE